jgi:hypothetical protein
MRKGHRYFVLSATGAGLSPSEVLEAGAFHQYTMATVDGQDVHIAIVQPGNIHRYDVAQREFTDKARPMLTWENRLPAAQGMNKGELIAHLKNDLEPLTMSFEYSPSDGISWDFAPIVATHVVQPGDQAEIVFKASYDFENLLPLPSFAYKISYEDKQFVQGSARITPPLTAIRKWMVVGPFDMGTREQPSGGAKLDTAPPAFSESLEPERNWVASATYTSVEETEENGWLNLDSIYGGDFAIAYGLCCIHSPDARKVFAAFNGDDLSKVIVNGEEAYSAGYSSNLNYIFLPLKEGWNTVLVKCADYNDAWGYTLQIADYKGQLRFAERCLQ